MAGLGSVAWPLGLLAILAGGYLLSFQAGLAPWFAIILVGAALLLLVGLAMTANSTRSRDPAKPARRTATPRRDGR